MPKSLALVASAYNELDEIRSQLLQAGIASVDVFPYLSEPVGYKFVEYNVRPDKTKGEILDLSKTISTFGFPDDEYEAPQRALYSEDNQIAMDNATRHLILENLEVTLSENSLSEVTRAKYNLRIEELRSQKAKLTSLSSNELKSKMRIEEDPMVIIAILAVLFDKEHCQDTTDQWGNPTRGYRTNKDKIVKSFLNPNSIKWMSELWVDLLPQQSKYNQYRHIKSLRTRALNLLNEKGSIYAIRFFIEFLIKCDEDANLPVSNTEEDTKIVYEGFDITEDIPFSLLILIPLLSVLEPVIQLI